jgi:hypothetical protein
MIAEKQWAAKGFVQCTMVRRPLSCAGLRLVFATGMKVITPLGQAVDYRLFFDTQQTESFALLFQISPNGAAE